MSNRSDWSPAKPFTFGALGYRIGSAARRRSSRSFAKSYATSLKRIETILSFCPPPYWLSVLSAPLSAGCFSFASRFVLRPSETRLFCSYPR